MRLVSKRRALVRVYLLGVLGVAALLGLWIPGATAPRANGFAGLEEMLRRQAAERTGPRMPTYVPPARVDRDMPRVVPDSSGSDRLRQGGARSIGYER